MGRMGHEGQIGCKRRDSTIEEIAARLGVRAERGRRFAELTSLRVGGAIDWVISPETEEQAAALVHELETKRTSRGGRSARAATCSPTTASTTTWF